MLQTPSPAAPRLGAGVSAGYASGSLVTGAFSTVPGLLMLPYLTDTLGVAAGLAGVLRSCPKPGGCCSTRSPGASATAPPPGPGRPYVLGAGLAVGVGFAVMFAGPFAAAAGAAWATAGYLLNATAFAFYQTLADLGFVGNVLGGQRRVPESPQAQSPADTTRTQHHLAEVAPPGFTTGSGARRAG